MTVGRIRDALGDLLLGARCAGCEAPSLGLCGVCRGQLGALVPVAVSRTLAGYPATAAAGEYAEVLRSVILAAKEQGALGHLPLLSELLARAVAAVVLAAPGPVTGLVLVPVPSVRARVIERGLDLTAELARRAARALRGRGPPVRVARAVRLVRNPQDQAGLGRAARAANSQGAYVWQGARAWQGPCAWHAAVPESQPRIVVVDDVVTTGATLAAVALAARTAGVPLLGAATVAQTPLRQDVATVARAPTP